MSCVKLALWKGCNQRLAGVMGLSVLDISLLGPTMSVSPPRWPLFQQPWTLSARGSRRDARGRILLSSFVPCTGYPTSSG
jgi:hypothetical protein